jgi:hypothetical protein
VTNNHVEGFHSKLNKWSQKIHPDIYTLLDLFKIIDSLMAQGFEIRKAADEEDEPERDAKMLDKYRKLKSYLDNMEKGHLSLEEYMQKANTLVLYIDLIYYFIKKY